jgi:hypothetical protein
MTAEKVLQAKSAARPTTNGGHRPPLQNSIDWELRKEATMVARSSAVL